VPSGEFSALAGTLAPLRRAIDDALARIRAAPDGPPPPPDPSPSPRGTP